MKEQRSLPVTVLLSGGLDSTSLVSFYLEADFSVRAIFIDYGQPAVRMETQASFAMARHFNIPLNVYRWEGNRTKNLGLIQGRNLFLLAAALMEIPVGKGMIGIGIHAGTAYPDCSELFIKAVQRLFDVYTQGELQLAAPFLTWTKRDIWDYAVKSKLPLDLTYSCEAGTVPPCKVCNSCKDREYLYACP